MVKVGIIGLGFMGRMHLEDYQKHPEVKIVAVSDTIAKKLKGDLSGGGNISTEKDIFDFTGIRTYEEADELIADEDVDLVDICLPTHLHAEFTIKALNKGKHVLCEKPMAGCLEECDSMIEAAEKAGKKLMIGQCLRFWPEYEVLKDYVENGKMGKLVYLSCFRGGEHLSGQRTTGFFKRIRVVEFSWTSISTTSIPSTFSWDFRRVFPLKERM